MLTLSELSAVDLLRVQWSSNQATRHMVAWFGTSCISVIIIIRSIGGVNALSALSVQASAMNMTTNVGFLYLKLSYNGLSVWRYKWVKYINTFEPNNQIEILGTVFKNSISNVRNVGNTTIYTKHLMGQVVKIPTKII